ncbi:MAG: DUF1993 family protein [Alphaproteobacteria bacterium]
MTLSLYDASVPVYRRSLENLSEILDKAVAWAKEHRVDPSVLLNSRLYPDMFPLVRQVQTATDQAKGAVHRLTGVENPKFPDTETTVDELKARIVRLIAFIESVPKEKFAGAEAREVDVRIAGEMRKINGRHYLFHVGLPHFFFHVTTAYDILRHNGVPLGKADYIGRGSL